MSQIICTVDRDPPDAENKNGATVDKAPALLLH